MHELTHAAEVESLTLFRDHDGNDWHDHYRSGFSLMDGEGWLGKFFVEGIAEFNAGLYARRMQDPTAPVTGVEILSDIDLPRHYADYAIHHDEPNINGPDGWAIELLAAQHEHMAPGGADVFIGHAPTRLVLATTRGCRAFAALRVPLMPFDQGYIKSSGICPTGQQSFELAWS